MDGGRCGQWVRSRMCGGYGAGIGIGSGFGKFFEEEVEGGCCGEYVRSAGVAEVLEKDRGRYAHVVPDVPPEGEVRARLAGGGGSVETEQAPERDRRECTESMKEQ